MTNELFTERDAILFEMQELKLQASRDFEIYLESRNMRNKRYSELQDRLREIDQAKPLERVILQKEPVLQEVKAEPIILNATPHLDVREERKKQFVVNAKKAEQSYKKKKYFHAPEKAYTLIAQYLRWNEEAQSSKDIQTYVENELNFHWKNFTDMMNKAMQHNNKIIKVRRGYYTYAKDDSQ